MNIVHTANPSIQQVGPIVPFSEAFSQQTKQAFKEIEGVADIRYFDVNALTKEDRTYLAKHTMSVPPQADLILAYVEGKFNIPFGRITLSGTATPLALAYADLPVSNRSCIAMSGEADETFANTIRHEIMHSLNFNHVDETKIPEKDRKEIPHYSVLYTYAYKPNRTLQEWDVERLQQVYARLKIPRIWLSGWRGKNSTCQPCKNK